MIKERINLHNELRFTAAEEIKKHRRRAGVRLGTTEAPAALDPQCFLHLTVFAEERSMGRSLISLLSKAPNYHHPSLVIIAHKKKQNQPKFC